MTPISVEAATLGFSPSTISRNVGEIFTVQVYISSADKSMNAASGIVSFPSGTIEVVSVSKASSIMNLWVQEPSFSNVQGKVNFEGVVLNPGYTGTRGNIVTIVFKAKSPGRADILFSSGSVLANDGSGTNILQGMGTASFTINVANTVVNTTADEVSPSVTIKKAGRSAPVVTSTTHPEQAKWYTDNTPEFSWKLPPNTLEMRTSIGKSATAVPTVQYTSLISKKKVDPLSDGTYYFSLQARTSDGWGDIARYRVNIDTTQPDSFLISLPDGIKGFKPQPTISFNTTDDGSGIKYYDIKIEGDNPARVEPAAVSNSYLLPPQEPGTHTVVVTAVDEAGNVKSASVDFTVEGIDSPNIASYQEEIESGDVIKIRGTTYKNSDVTIFIKQGGEIVFKEQIKSNSLGDFSAVIEKKLSPGVYTFTAQVTDARGARSEETQPLNLIVSTAFLVRLADLILKYLSVAILGVLILASVATLSLFLWYRLLKIVRRFRHDVRETEHLLKKSFNLLRKDIDEHIAQLKSVKLNRKLTDEEIMFLDRFEKDLSESESIITKEFDDISKG